MNAIIDVLKSFWRLFVWWVVVQPWELGLRIRIGKDRLLLRPGLHFRIPYVDAVYKQSVRLRWTTLAAQTLTTSDGHTLTMHGQLGYTIVDLDRLYDTLHQAENAVRSLASGAVAKYVHGRSMAECSPAQIEDGAATLIDLGRYGIEFRTLQLTTFCRVKTYRIINDQHADIWDDLLDTSRDDSPRPAR